MTIIGSRDTMCVNRSLELIKGKGLDRKCEEYCSKGICQYNRNGSNRQNQKSKNYSQHLSLPLLTIPQLRTLALSSTFCPYYLSRQTQEHSQLVLMTYNYFLCHNLFLHSTFSIKDSVIIFDQAHNIDQISQQGCSIQIGGDIVRRVVKELRGFMKGFEKYGVSKLGKKEKEIGRVKGLYGMVESLGREMEKVEEGRVLDGFGGFIRYLEHAMNAKNNPLFHKGLTLASLNDICVMGKQIAHWMRSESYHYLPLQQFISYLQDIHSLISSTQPNQQHLFQISIVKQPTMNQTKILFLCLSASFIFSKISSKKPRSLLFASGTLKPLNYWQQEIGLKFPIKLSSQSFITKSHLYSLCISSYKGKQFDFSFHKRTEQDQIENLLKFIEDLCMVVENGGIIVAFSSYEIMQFALELYNPDSFRYRVFWESKGCKIEELIEEYGEQARKGGAILFMVMRGKFAEGIDFHDELCRAMIVVGIPFAPINDPRLQAKRRFLNKPHSTLSSNLTLPSFIPASQTIFTKSVTYDEWYVIQAIRVVNQAIGRVIRHNKDYGCVFLLDKKYEKGYIREYLPEWLVRCMRPSYSKEAIGMFLGRVFEGEGKEEEREMEELLIVEEEEEKKVQNEEITQMSHKKYVNQSKKLYQFQKQKNIQKQQPLIQTQQAPISRPKRLSKFQQATLKIQRKVIQLSQTVQTPPTLQLQQINFENSCMSLQQNIPIDEQSSYLLGRVQPKYPKRQSVDRNRRKMKKKLGDITFKKYSPPLQSQDKWMGEDDI